MNDRPEYVKCIKRPMANSTTSWCDRDLAGEWAFIGLDHAAANVLTGGRLVVCGDCIQRVLPLFAATGPVMGHGTTAVYVDGSAGDIRITGGPFKG